MVKEAVDGTLKEGDLVWFSINETIYGHGVIRGLASAMPGLLCIWIVEIESINGATPQFTCITIPSGCITKVE